MTLLFLSGRLNQLVYPTHFGMNKRSQTCSTFAQRSGSFHMTQRVDYATFLLTVLAQSGERIPLSSIARQNHLSFAFLQKMAGLLRVAGLIRSIRGKTGGYVLAKPCNKIIFRDIVHAVEGEVAPHACVQKHSSSFVCPRMSLCSIRPALNRLHTQMQELYLSKPLTYFLHQQ